MPKKATKITSSGDSVSSENHLSLVFAGDDGELPYLLKNLSLNELAENGKDGLQHSKNQEVSILFPHLQETISQIVELWKRRQAAHRAEKSLTLQIKSFCRRLCGGDKIHAQKLYEAIVNKTDHVKIELGIMSTMFLFNARETVKQERDRLEKILRKLALTLPGMKFIQETKGLSENTLVALIGEAPGNNFRGFLDFDTPERLFKRFGLAVMGDGTRQRKVEGAAAIEHGYSPIRRSVMWTFGDSLIKCSDGPYRLIYDQAKLLEQKRAEERGQRIVPSADIPEKNKVTSEFISQGVIHLRAQRKMEKAMLRDLWAAFRAEYRGEKAPGVGCVVELRPGYDVTRREEAAVRIKEIIEKFGTENEKRLKKELREGYCFGLNTWRREIWYQEIEKQTGLSMK